jgi:hypothetical protein
MAVSFIGRETGEPGENHDLSQVTDKLYQITEFELPTLVVIGSPI